MLSKSKLPNMFDMPTAFEDWKVDDINSWSRQTYGGARVLSKEEREEMRKFSAVKKRLKSRLSILKAIAIANPEINSRWQEYTANYSSYNHIVEFIEAIISHCLIYNDEETIGQIEATDDGSRGLARTLTMRLYDKAHTRVLLEKSLHQNKYYYL